MKRFFTASIVVFLAFCPLRAQDIHFTLFEMAPLAFNPAETGAFYGTYRLSGIYRDQWLSAFGAPNEFKTPSFSVDVPLIKGFRDQDWVGVGLMMFSDKAGSLDMTWGAFKLSAAYHLSLNKKQTSVLTLGYQTGSVQRRIKKPEDASLLDPEPGIVGAGPEGLKKSFTDHVGGLLLTSRPDKENIIKVGFSVSNLAGPDGSLLSGSMDSTISRRRYELPLRMVGQGSWRHVMTDKLAVKGALFFQSFGAANEIVLQGTGEYLFNAEKRVVLRGGVGYRFGDALQVLAGIDIKDLRVMLGYDLNISRFTPATGTFGGFEISAMYVGTIFKRPDPDPVLFCPRF